MEVFGLKRKAMQFVNYYESGIGQKPLSVMVGYVEDSHRMRLTKEILANHFERYAKNN
jgi:hypothetical protein